MIDEVVSQAASHGSSTSSVDADDDIVSTTDEGPPTTSSLASHQQTPRPNTSPSTVSSHRLPTASPSTVSSHSRCSCSWRVTDIRAFSGFHSDGDVDDAVAMETRQQLQRSLRSTTSEGGAFRRVLPSSLDFQRRSHSNDIAPTPRDHDVTQTRELNDLRSLAVERDMVDRLTEDKHTDNTGTKEAGRSRRREASDWLKAAGLAIDRQRKRTATSDWVRGVVAEVQPGQRRRRGRQVMSVVKSGAGLRAISETGDTCRLAAVSSSLAADVSHPVIRGLYRQAPAPSLASASIASSTSSAASVTAAARQQDRAPSDDDSSHDSQHSV